VSASFQRWLVKWGKRRFERELEDYRNPPELRVGPFGRVKRDAQQQVFRSLVQVNFYPRERE
jgi:hypothetical protein